MMAALATLAVIALTVGPSRDIGIGADHEGSIARAERDFDAGWSCYLADVRRAGPRRALGQRFLKRFNSIYKD